MQLSASVLTMFEDEICHRVAEGVVGNCSRDLSFIGRTRPIHMASRSAAVTRTTSCHCKTIHLVLKNCEAWRHDFVTVQPALPHLSSESREVGSAGGWLQLLSAVSLWCCACSIRFATCFFFFSLTLSLHVPCRVHLRSMAVLSMCASVCRRLPIAFWVL